MGNKLQKFKEEVASVRLPRTTRAAKKDDDKENVVSDSNVPDATHNATKPSEVT